MKKYLLSALAAISMTSAQTIAQMPYNVSIQQQAYQPLTGSTSINGTTIWDDEDFTVPLGFTMNINGKAVSRFNLSAGNTLTTDTTGTIQAISLFGADIIDRGALGSNSMSPISYKVTGSAGSRVFTAEIANLGFADEMYIDSTLDDSANIQVKLYEGTNVIEIHFGPSRLTSMSNYFPFGGPMLGYVKNTDMDSGNFEKLYFLSGNPLTPTVDSADDGSMSFPSLSSYPASGTMYRFTPKPAPTGIHDVLTTKINVYPTQCSDALFIDRADMPDTYYQVLSLSGVVMTNGKAQDKQTRIDVSNLPSGMYLLRIDNVVGHDIRKFVKL